MAEVYAVKTGNWSDDTVWNTGTAPTASDDVYANAYTVTIDEDVTVLSIRNTAGATASAGGGFVLEDGWTVTADLYSTTNVHLVTYAGMTSADIVGNVYYGGTSSTTYTVNATSGALTITGNLAPQTNEGYGLKVSGSANVTIVGDVVGGGSTNRWAVNVSAGAVTVTGNVTAGEANGGRGIYGTNGSITVNGNVTGASTTVSNGIYHTGTVTVNGTITSSGSAGVFLQSSGKLIHNGDGVSSAQGIPPLQMNSTSATVLINDTTEITHTYRTDDSGSPGPARSLYTGGPDIGNPATTDVRSGTTFGPSSEYTGTLAVPDAQYVSQGVSVDATVGTLTGAGTLAAGTAQGGTSTTIQLAASETFGDDILNGNIVKITGGTGAGQSRRITDYVGSTDTATVHEAWTTNPDNTSTYEVVEGSHVTGISAAEVNAEVVDVINVDTLVAGVTVAEALRRIGAVCSYKISGAGSGTETVTPWDDGAETIVFTVDSSGNRTAVTFN